MDFLDNAVNKAKEAFDIACKKTEEAVTTQKQKFDIAAEENKRNKDYAKLGEIYFNMIKDSEIDNTQVKDLVDAIKTKNEKIVKIKKEIGAADGKKICNVCGTEIDIDSVFCGSCGTKVGFGE